MYHMINIHEFCTKYSTKVSIFRELEELVTPELHGLVETINSALDFSNTEKRSRPVIKFGLDCDLDASKFLAMPGFFVCI